MTYGFHEPEERSRSGNPPTEGNALANTMLKIKEGGFFQVETSQVGDKFMELY